MTGRLSELVAEDIAAQTRTDLAHHTVQELRVLLRFVRTSTDSATAQMHKITERQA